MLSPAHLTLILSSYSLRATFVFFFFNDTATPEIYTLSLTTLFRSPRARRLGRDRGRRRALDRRQPPAARDRKSTRLNSSHITISYAVFCLKKKKKAIHYNRKTITPPPQIYTHIQNLYPLLAMHTPM